MNDKLNYRLLLTTEQAARKLGVDRRYVESLISAGEIKVVPIRTRIRVPLVQLERWIDRNSVTIMEG